ncbi:hypothetical protein PG994_001996 [Apiospora phragmitis]|uniref:Stc1 domain-containing protein n=1 Tax=Apiospora phragmitis TaxID=2905665 RepID=A0ABR1WV48_9PEZI
MSTVRDNAMPKKLWCCLTSHWEVRERFSNNQKAKFQNAQRRSRLALNNPAIKALNMVCQLHSGQPVAELKCHGPCSLYKHRDKFSKNQRRNKLRWCMDCCTWRSQFDIGDVPVAHPNEDLSQTETAGNPTRVQNDMALLARFPFDYALDEATQDDDLGGADDMDSDLEDDEYPSAAQQFNGWSDSDDGDEDDEVLYTQILPARSVSHGQSSQTDIGQRLGNMSLGASSNIALAAKRSGQATRTATPTENTPGRRMSPSVTSVWNDSSSKQTVSMGGNSRASEASTPAFAGCTPGFVPPHLQAARAGNGGYSSATGTPSVVSSDSRAGITNASMYSSEFSRNGPAARGPVGRPISTSATTQSGNAGNNTRRRPDRNGWARPDQRRNFDKQTHFATSAADYIETHESGSEDEVNGSFEVMAGVPTIRYNLHTSVRQ